MKSEVTPNIRWHHATGTRERRERLNAHRSVILWFTGLSGSGKSTLAHTVEVQLHQMGCRTFVIDGGNVRDGLNRDLGFSKEDRKENIRRIGEPCPSDSSQTSYTANASRSTSGIETDCGSRCNTCPRLKTQADGCS